MTDRFGQGKNLMARGGVLKGSIAAGGANCAGNAIAIENPHDHVIVVNRVVSEVKTAAEAASQLLVGIGDNASDNVENAAAFLLNVNAMNVGVDSGPATGINANCRINKNGESANAFLLVGVDVPANADSLVADVYAEYYIID